MGLVVTRHGATGCGRAGWDGLGRGGVAGGCRTRHWIALDGGDVSLSAPEDQIDWVNQTDLYSMSTRYGDLWDGV